MIYQKYYITGTLREPILFTEWAFIFLSIELGITFILKYLEKPKEIRNLQEISYASLFISYAITWIFFLIRDFYSTTSQYMSIFMSLAHLTIAIGGFFFIFFIEKKIIFFRKYLFSILILLVIFYSLIYIIIDFSLTPRRFFFFWLIFLSFIILYLRDLTKRIKTDIEAKYTFFKFIVGFFSVAFGFMLSSETITEYYGFEAILLGVIIQLVAIGYLYVLLSFLPPLSEFDWHDKIHSVFLMHKSGIHLYSKIFQENSKKVDENLITGLINSIHIMLDEVTNYEGISVIKKGENITIIYPKKYIIGVLFCSEDLNSLKYLLKNFVEKTEKLYESILSQWNGDLKIFKPVDAICNSIFEKK